MAQLDTSAPVETLVQKALEVMKTEREAIVAGAFDTVYGLTEEKSELLTAIDARFSKMALDGASPSKQAMRAGLQHMTTLLSHTAASNMRLLKSAQDGVEMAREELGSVTEKAAAGFYAAGGKKIAIEGNSMKEIKKI